MRLEWTDAVRRERQARGQRCPVVTGRTYGDLYNALAEVYGSPFRISFHLAGGGATVATRDGGTIGTVRMDDTEEKYDEFSPAEATGQLPGSSYLPDDDYDDRLVLTIHGTRT